MTIVSLPDIAGDGAAHRISTADIRARRLWLSSSVNTTTRFGDASVAAGQGVALNTQATVLSANDADQLDGIPLNECWVFVPNGSVCSISYGV